MTIAPIARSPYALATGIAARMKATRKRMGITQTAAAEKMDIRAATLSRWEAGIVAPSVKMLELIAEFYGVSVEFLMGPVAARAVPPAIPPSEGDMLRQIWGDNQRELSESAPSVEQTPAHGASSKKPSPPQTC